MSDPTTPMGGPPGQGPEQGRMEHAETRWTPPSAPPRPWTEDAQQPTVGLPPSGLPTGLPTVASPTPACPPPQELLIRPLTPSGGTPIASGPQYVPTASGPGMYPPPTGAPLTTSSQPMPTYGQTPSSPPRPFGSAPPAGLSAGLAGVGQELTGYSRQHLVKLAPVALAGLMALYLLLSALTGLLGLFDERRLPIDGAYAGSGFVNRLFHLSGWVNAPSVAILVVATALVTLPWATHRLTALVRCLLAGVGVFMGFLSLIKAVVVAASSDWFWYERLVGPFSALTLGVTSLVVALWASGGNLDNRPLANPAPAAPSQPAPHGTPWPGP